MFPRRISLIVLVALSGAGCAWHAPGGAAVNQAARAGNDADQLRPVWVLRGDKERLEYLRIAAMPPSPAIVSAPPVAEAGTTGFYVVDPEGAEVWIDPFAHGGGNFSRPPVLPPPDPQSTIETRLMGVSPQYWYKRSDFGGATLNVPRYREGNYTPGYYTSEGYVRGHYRAEGVYTRGEHRSEGYIRGDYRSTPMPSFVPQVRPMAPISTRPVPVR